jgi:hypothetical protein
LKSSKAAKGKKGEEQSEAKPPAKDSKGKQSAADKR